MSNAVRRPCPACTTEEMQLASLGAVEIDVCPKCLGAWFDGGELGAVVEGARVGQLLAAARTGESRCWGCDTPVAGPLCKTCSAGQLACPECGRNGLVRVQADDVELDVCSPCGGFWFDKDELARIAGDRAPDLRELLGRKQGASGPRLDGRIVCSHCDRQLRRAHAFREGDDVFCGSCAPSGAGPLVVDVSSLRKHSDLDDNDPWSSDHDGPQLIVSLFRWLSR